MKKIDDTKEKVILVDDNDNQIGEMSKLEAHFKGKLHRALSVFVFNTKGELLMQQRAKDKYHSGGKWTNTCCSHPRLGEKTHDAAVRRLDEEMGMVVELVPVFRFRYQAEVMKGVIEHEYDHVFFGVTDDLPVINPAEVSAYEYVNMDVLSKELISNPDKYTEWLKISFEEVMDYYLQMRF
ncbi:isopentenyl-diphosphate Delta-isomerase [Pedobacter nyackensis]|uniref:isopentenyl-diphosphate Delta-isomerase n=1 Tax=Pedobacter nyackensis TaxID=475255 RepID=UPI0029309E39|nr:isopentenyl-diphosphate Delta-isomerase [Pedobacter nyackensis]